MSGAVEWLMRLELPPAWSAPHRCAGGWNSCLHYGGWHVFECDSGWHATLLDRDVFEAGGRELEDYRLLLGLDFCCDSHSLAVAWVEARR